MKILKEIKTGNLVKTTNEEAAKKVKSGLFRYSTKGRWKSVLKDLKKIENRPKTPPAPFGSGKARKLKLRLLKYSQKKDTRGRVVLKLIRSKDRIKQLAAEARNKKRANRRRAKVQKQSRTRNAC